MEADKASLDKAIATLNGLDSWKEEIRQYEQVGPRPLPPVRPHRRGRPIRRPPCSKAPAPRARPQVLAWRMVDEDAEAVAKLEDLVGTTIPERTQRMAAREQELEQQLDALSQRAEADVSPPRPAARCWWHTAPAAGWPVAVRAAPRLAAVCFGRPPTLLPSSCRSRVDRCVGSLLCLAYPSCLPSLPPCPPAPRPPACPGRMRSCVGSTPGRPSWLRRSRSSRGSTAQRSARPTRQPARRRSWRSACRRRPPASRRAAAVAGAGAALVLGALSRCGRWPVGWPAGAAGPALGRPRDGRAKMPQPRSCTPTPIPSPAPPPAAGAVGCPGAGGH